MLLKNHFTNSICSKILFLLHTKFLIEIPSQDLVIFPLRLVLLWVLTSVLWLWIGWFSWLEMNGLNENFILVLWNLFFFRFFSCCLMNCSPLYMFVRILPWNGLNGKFTLWLYEWIISGRQNPKKRVSILNISIFLIRAFIFLFCFYIHLTEESLRRLQSMNFEFILKLVAGRVIFLWWIFLAVSVIHIFFSIKFRVFDQTFINFIWALFIFFLGQWLL